MNMVKKIEGPGAEAPGPASFASSWRRQVRVRMRIMKLS
jgi:hypothetical protein